MDFEKIYQYLSPIGVIAVLLAFQFDQGAQLRREIGALRSEMKEEIAALRGEVKMEIKALRSELKGDIETLRDEFDALRGEFGSLEASLRKLAERVARIEGAVNYALRGKVGGPPPERGADGAARPAPPEALAGS